MNLLSLSPFSACCGWKWPGWTLQSPLQLPPESCRLPAASYPSVQSHCKTRCIFFLPTHPSSESWWLLPLPSQAPPHPKSWVASLLHGSVAGAIGALSPTGSVTLGKSLKLSESQPQGDHTRPPGWALHNYRLCSLSHGALGLSNAVTCLRFLP